MTKKNLGKLTGPSDGNLAESDKIFVGGYGFSLIGSRATSSLEQIYESAGIIKIETKYQN
jgi:hypothetical protein